MDKSRILEKGTGAVGLRKVVIRVGQVVNVRCTDKDFKDVVLAVTVSHILRDVTYRGFHESGKELNSIDYTKIGITNDDYNHNHIIRFEHADTDYKWAYLYQIMRERD